MKSLILHGKKIQSNWFLIKTSSKTPKLVIKRGLTGGQSALFLAALVCSLSQLQREFTHLVVSLSIHGRNVAASTPELHVAARRQHPCASADAKPQLYNHRSERGGCSGGGLGGS